MSGKGKAIISRCLYVYVLNGSVNFAKPDISIINPKIPVTVFTDFFIYVNC
tara:strand:- start:1672 stop:1824 length:153 start_codon:yes stop_codon:yes gene_type:complete